MPSKIANPFIRAHHYSGKVVNNSCLHFGAFLDGRLHGVLSYGPSLDKKKIIGLVEGTAWDGFLELRKLLHRQDHPPDQEAGAAGKMDYQLCRRLLLRRRHHLPGLQFRFDRHQKEQRPLPPAERRQNSRNDPV